MTQVWDFLSRFHENLGLKEALSLEELEEDLFNLQGGGVDILQNSENEFKKDPLLNSLNTEFSNDRVSSKFNANGDPHAFIQMETRVMKEVSEGNLASSTDSRCVGAALTKAHTSLLRVLITELQSKVAALVDPNFDSGESKPKRGRKKDADSASSIRKMKLNLLPLNELTWPELAHRFILAVLSMNGNLESAEVTARESGRVFRCLQGDGGVLCGSHTGVAGMEADAFVRWLLVNLHLFLSVTSLICAIVIRFLPFHIHVKLLLPMLIFSSDLQHNSNLYGKIDNTCSLTMIALWFLFDDQGFIIYYNFCLKEKHEVI